MTSDRWVRSRPVAGPLLVLLVMALTGCGAEVHVSSRPKKLDGTTLATRANAQLQKQNPQMVRGDLTCEDVTFKVGATSACLRTVVFEDGRLVRIGGTVVIDRVKDGGHFNIKLDDAPQEFGLTGKSVFAELAKQYARQLKTTRPTGSCPPYLAGKVGTTMTCDLALGADKQRVEVRVTGVNPKSFATAYSFKSVS